MSHSNLARRETLIVLDYLLHNTNENNLSSNNDIVEFAFKKYSHIMDRRRAAETLKELYSANEEFKDLPFEILRVSTGEYYKYWGQYKPFDKNGLKRLLIAIFDSPYLSLKGIQRIKYDLCQTITDEHTFDEVYESLKKTHLKPNPFGNLANDIMFNKLNFFHRTIETGKRIVIRLEDKYKVKSRGYLNTSGHIECAVYKTVDFNGEKYVILVEKNDKTWFATPLTNIKVKSLVELMNEPINFDVRYPVEGYETVEKFIDDYLLPSSSEITKISFSIEDDESAKSHILKSFESYFNKSLEFMRIARDGRYRREATTVLQHELFLDWVFSDPINLSKIKILEPISLATQIKAKLSEILTNQINDSDTEIHKYKIMVWIPQYSKEDNTLKLKKYERAEFITIGTEQEAADYGKFIVENSNVPSGVKDKIKINIVKVI